MAWYLRSDYGQEDLLKNKRGGGKLGLGLDDIRDSRVPVVSDSEATRIFATIEARLSVCVSIEKTVDTALQQATNKISNAAILYRVVQMIDREKWVSMFSDVKGEIYEGLLQKNAEDIKSGAGQYFTPRPLIKTMVKCLRPEPGKTIADPCCGSGQCAV